MFTARALDGADAESYRALRLEALESYPTAFLTTADEFRAKPLEDIAKQLDQGASWAVFEGNQAVGIAALLPLRYKAAAHRAEIGAFFVSPAAQGGGAARVLLTSMAHAAKQRGIWQLELYVADDNARARRFYEKQGFREMGRLPNAAIVGGVVTSDFFMVADLR
ncbi:MAG: GNAT family N-acetyltransferase [Pseudomonadota bacterium]